MLYKLHTTTPYALLAVYSIVDVVLTQPRRSSLCQDEERMRSVLVSRSVINREHDLLV
jgi:hypothetical protein